MKRTSNICVKRLQEIDPVVVSNTYRQVFRMAEGKRSLLVLISTMSMNREQVQNQSRATTMLEAKKIPFETIDGADPSMKER